MLYQGKYKKYPVTLEITKPRERNYHKAWRARTGNIVTTSVVSKRECLKRHIEKLDEMYEADCDEE